MFDKANTNVILSLATGAALGAGITLLYNKLKMKKNQQNNEKLAQKANQNAKIDFQTEEYQTIMREQLIRNFQFFGEEGQSKIMNSFIIIAGVGGVGSHLCIALARAGVKKIRIIDFDQITLSSLNRHAFATREDVGISKCQATKNYVQKIFPHVEIEVKEDYLTKTNIQDYINDNPDYVIDCIDNIDAKVALIAYCKHNKLRVISSGGAGMKDDPTQIQIRDLFDVSYDDLARSLRQKLKKLNVNQDVTVVYSSQKAERELLPLKEHQLQNPSDYKVFENYRLRIVPVLGTMPAIFGNAIAAYVLCDLAGQKFKPYIQDDIHKTNYVKLYNKLLARLKEQGATQDDYQFDLSDMFIVAREAYQWKSIISNVKSYQQEMVRWDKTKPADIYNIVLMNNKEIETHFSYDNIEGKYPQEVYDRFKERQEIIRKIVQSKEIQYC